MDKYFELCRTSRFCVYLRFTVTLVRDIFHFTDSLIMGRFSAAEACEEQIICTDSLGVGGRYVRKLANFLQCEPDEIQDLIASIHG